MQFVFPIPESTSETLQVILHFFYYQYFNHYFLLINTILRKLIVFFSLVSILRKLIPSLILKLFCCRIVHFQPEQGGYNCITCKCTFSTWRSFKRHRELKHGEHIVLTCTSCSYTTVRKDNMSRHMKFKHGVWKMVSSLIDDIIDHLGEVRDVNEELIEVAPLDGDLSPYEKARNLRVAELHAEFQRKFPNFQQEVQDLSVRRKKRVRNVKKSATPIMTRRSTRGSKGDSVDELEVVGEIDLTAELPVTNSDIPNIQAEVVCFDQAGDTGDLEKSDIGKFGCVPCDLSFRDLPNMRRHVMLMHEPRRDPVSCPRIGCMAEFSTMSEMTKHREMCWMACPYPGCDKKYRKKREFDAHQRAHLVMARRMKD